MTLAVSTPDETPPPAEAAATPANAMLEACGIVMELGRGAGKVRALKGVNLTLNAGELTLLMDRLAEKRAKREREFRQSKRKP